MSGIYDGRLGDLRSLHGETATIHVVGVGYVPSSAHADLTDIDPGDILGAETTTLSVGVTSNVLTLSCSGGEVEVDPIDLETIAGIVVTWNDGSDDLLVCWIEADPQTAEEPQTVQFPTGLITEAGGFT